MGFVPVTRMVLPFLTQVIVFFALFVVGDGDAVGEIEGLGSAVGVVGLSIGASS